MYVLQSPSALRGGWGGSYAAGATSGVGYGRQGGEPVALPDVARVADVVAVVVDR